MNSAPNDWIVIDYVREALDDIRRRLKAGSEGPGATLTADECLKVLACLRDPPWPNGSEPDDFKPYRDKSMARYCIGLERGGMPLKAAVQETTQRFDCKRSTVYRARKAYAPRKAPSK